MCVPVLAFVIRPKSHLPYAAIYRHLQPVWLYQIFSHYLIDSTNFRGKKIVEDKMCGLIFSTSFV